MIKQAISVCVGAAVWMAVAAEGAKPQSELVGTAEFASFNELQQKMVNLGTTINNPVVPMLAMPGIQNTLTETFGKFRQDAPMKLYCYVQMPAFRKAMANKTTTDLNDVFDLAFVYPTAEDQTAFIASHPEAKKEADGSIKLDDDVVVVYAADGRTCAFATSTDTAKRALSAPPPAAAAARPIARLDLTEAGIAILADFQQRLNENQMSMLNASRGTNDVAKIMGQLAKYQETQSRMQNRMLRSFASGTVTIDLDSTGFVAKGSAKAKPGAYNGMSCGARLPAGVFDEVPVGSPFYGAYYPNQYLSEKDWCEYLDVLNGLVGTLMEYAKQNMTDPKYAKYVPTMDGLRAASVDYLNSLKSEFLPSAWCAGALAFGPKQEPYLVQYGTVKSTSKSIADASRFFAAVAAAIDKSWPGIVSAKGASIAVDWARLMDVAAAEAGVKDDAQKELAQAKKTVAAILGSTKTEWVIGAQSAAKYGSCIIPAGFKLPPAKPYGEARLASAVPEAAKDRPFAVAYVSLYSLLRDNVLPIVLKAMPKEKTQEVQAFASMMPPSSPNGAMAFAGWSDADGSCRFLFRITSDEIRNFGAAANAAMMAGASEQDTGDDDDDDAVTK